MKSNGFNSIVNLIVLLAVCLAISACGRGSSSNDVVLSDVIIFVPDGYKNPETDQKFELSAVAVYQGTISSETITDRAQWESSNPETATISEAGEVTTLTEGNVTFSATYQDMTAKVNLTIKLPPFIESINYREEGLESSVVEDTSISLIVESVYSNGDILTDSSLVDWTSSDPEIASVDETGIVTGEKFGEATITVTLKENPELLAELSVTVQPKVEGITLGKDITYVDVGETAFLVVKEVLSDESSTEIPNLVKWEFDQADVVRVTATGKIIASEPKEKVTATITRGEFSITHEIVIEEPIRLFVEDASNGKISVRWKEKKKAIHYNLFWNTSDSTEEDNQKKIEITENREHSLTDIDISKSYIFWITFNIDEDTSVTSEKLEVWHHNGEWKFREFIEPRLNAAGAAVNEKMYFFGGDIITKDDQGNDVASPSNEVWEYNILSEKWVRETSLPASITKTTACTDGNLIYVIGGEDSEGNPVVTISQYETELNTMNSSLISLPKALSQTACTITNGFIYIAGGHNGDSSTSETYRYDIVNEVWDTTLPALNTGRHQHSINVLNDVIYIAGGAVGSDPASGQVEKLDISVPVEEFSWQNISAMSSPRTGFSLHVWDSKLHAIGGKDIENKFVESIASFDPDTNTWQEIDNIQFGNAYFNSTKYLDAIYLWGGLDTAAADTGADESNDQYYLRKYNISDQSWEQQISSKSARKDFDAVMLNNNLYVIGGNRHSVATNTVTKIDVLQNNWLKANPLINYRYGSTANTFQEGKINKIYVMGGKNEDDVTIKEAELYDETSNTWTEILSMTEPRAYAASAYLDRKIYVFGGKNDTESISSFEVYDIEKETWRLLGAMSDARSHATAVALNDRIYLIGGYINDTVTDRVDVYIPSNNNWAKNRITGSLKHARIQPGSTVFNGMIYVFGGKSLDNEPLRSAEVFSVINNDWSEIDNLPHYVNSAKGGTFENKIYLLSDEGSSNTDISNTLFILE